MRNLLTGCPGRGISFLILLELYLAGRANGLLMDANLVVMADAQLGVSVDRSLCVVMLLAVGYVAFKKKYYWMHEEYLKSIKK